MRTILMVSERMVALDVPGTVWHAQTVNEVLAMTVHYHPRVILLDARSAVARQAFIHLSDVAPESPYGLMAMLVINAGDAVWPTPDGAVLWCVPGAPDAAVITELIEDRDYLQWADYMPALPTI